MPANEVARFEIDDDALRPLGLRDLRVVVQHRENPETAIVFDDARAIDMGREQDRFVIRRAVIAAGKRGDGLERGRVLFLMRVQDQRCRLSRRRIGEHLCAGDAIEHQTAARCDCRGVGWMRVPCEASGDMSITVTAAAAPEGTSTFVTTSRICPNWSRLRKLNSTTDRRLLEQLAGKGFGIRAVFVILVADVRTRAFPIAATAGPRPVRAQCRAADCRNSSTASRAPARRAARAAASRMSSRAAALRRRSCPRAPKAAAAARPGD